MLYTKKGDDGKTNFFGCDQRFSKSSKIAEALGALDEINSYLGWCKVKIGESLAAITEEQFGEKILGMIQQDLFIIQAEVAGADETVTANKVFWQEDIICQIEKELPKIDSFIVSGGTEASAMLDFARSVARRAERRAVEVSEEGAVNISKETLAYLNRLSSLLYALARFANVKTGIEEEKPRY